jgi:hypothetical protein
MLPKVKDFETKWSSGCVDEGDKPEASNLDELARGLAEGTISRRQALKWAGLGVVGVALFSLGFADRAEAITPRRCRRRYDGTPLEAGQCDCGFICGGRVQLPPCGNDPDCFCYQTVTGRGFCGRNSACRRTCASNADCSPDRRCVVNTCCPGPGICARPC